MRAGRALWSLGLAALASLIFAPAAFADDSQIKVSEVYSDGSTSHGDYIELQLAADGQQIPAGHSIVLFNANASASITYPFPDNTIVNESQRTILFGWSDNPVADFTASNLPIPAAGGAVCLSGSSGPPVVPIDCVSWGSGFPPAASTSLGTGTPAHALNALQSLTRKITPNCPTFLEPADDTNNSAADFSLAAPSPRNNLSNPTEVPCTAPAAATTTKKKCKKKKKHRSAEAAKKKRCKKRKR